MSEIARSLGPDALVASGVRLLTPPVREFYALLLRAGVLVIDD
ncbi:Rv1535 domain-containing protein [Gordonia amicalis]|nr:Rv1535 domain-containing protein [Gordonia amicalis]MCZ4580386.1 Rv1535 domain-containing protein [Gordonia amicalis]